MMPVRFPELRVPNAAAWRQWLAAEGNKTPVVWLVVARKGATEPNLNYAEALDEALCYGWIDSGGGPRDETTRWLRFGPRKAKSPWSRRNIGYVERLEGEGRMTDAGRAAIEQAKVNGLWNAAYSAGSAPTDLMEAIAREPSAQMAWNAMTKKDHYSIFVKMGNLPIPSQTRDKKIAAIVEKLRDQPEAPKTAQSTRSMPKTKSISKKANPSTKGSRRSARLAAKSI